MPVKSDATFIARLAGHRCALPPLSAPAAGCRETSQSALLRNRGRGGRLFVREGARARAASTLRSRAGRRARRISR